MAVDERALRETTDAAVWAKAFLEVIDQPDIEVDFGLMVGWFANAIETAKASVHRNGFSDAEAAIAIAFACRGANLIKAERQRQIDQEGWTPEHDDGHANDLVLAAIAYSYEAIRSGHPMALAIWPWGEEWWKPADRVRNLVKAGALIAAEIDRLQRATSQSAVHVADDDAPDRDIRPGHLSEQEVRE